MEPITILKPKFGVYFTPDDVNQAKRNIAAYPWAKKAFETIEEECREHMKLSDRQVYDAIIGMHQGTFAYGISGCPHCSAPLPFELKDQKGLFSGLEDLPRKTFTCAACHMTFPNEAYPDDGHGFEQDGKAYYIIGMWNFYHGVRLLGGVRNHEGLVTKLVTMYMLTGERAYAEKAIVLLDAFSAIFPGSIGPRDFTDFGSDFEIGRLHLLTSIVHRVKIWLAHDYDWLFMLPELDQPSKALQLLGREGTIRENIEYMLNDYMLSEPGGPVYDLTDGQMTNLQNHEADGVRAMLAVGLVLGNREYCEWGLKSLEAYIYNAIGRDGMYFESSFGYSLFASSVFLDLALLSCRAADLLEKEVNNPFADNRFYRFAVENPLDMLCEGHLPSFGDWGADRVRGNTPDMKTCTEVYRAAQFFYHFTPNDVIRENAGSALMFLYPMVEGNLGGRCAELFFAHNGVHSPIRKPQLKEDEPTVMGQAGISIIRKNNTAALMRYGRNSTHAHDDILSYVYYKEGQEISADIGYGVYGTNAHYGWASKAIAHNTVVVNRDQMIGKNQLFKPFSGGELTTIYNHEDVSVMEGDATSLYKSSGVSMYRRMVGLVNTVDGDSYTIDFFRVEGARTADFAFHVFHDNSTLEMQEVSPSHRAHWTLAGVDSPEKLYFDEPGKSFGERLTTGETFVPLFPGEKPRLWTTELNNGYGYIYNVKEYKPEANVFRALWKSVNGDSYYYYGLCELEDRLFTGYAPSLEGDRKHGILVHRGAHPDVQFAVVAYCGLLDETRSREVTNPIREVKKLQAEGANVTALAVHFLNGMVDYWIYSPAAQMMKVLAHGVEWKVNGRCGMLRLDSEGRVVEAHCILAASMTYGEFQKTGKEDAWFLIDQVDETSGTVWIASAPPPNYSPKYVRVRRKEGKESMVYTIKGLYQSGRRTAIKLTDSFILSKGVVQFATDTEIQTLYPIPLGVGLEGESPFIGKKIVGQLGGLGTITEAPEMKRLFVHVIRSFSEGETFDIIDLEPGYELQWV